MAMPTLVAAPCPSGPVVVSTPAVRPYSGWPEQRLAAWRKVCKSAIVTANSLLPAAWRTPQRYSSAYSSAEAWPTESTKWSRSGQAGSAGSERRKRCHSV